MATPDPYQIAAGREARYVTLLDANGNPIGSAAKAEDVAHASGDVGAFVLGVRNDGLAATFTSNDGDYSPIAVDSRGRLTVLIQAGSGQSTNSFAAGDALANSHAALLVQPETLLYNGATWDRMRANIEGTALASAARTGTTQSADIVNYNGRGVHVFLNITVVPGVDTVSVSVLAKDPVSGAYKTVLLSPPVGVAGSFHYQVYPGVTDAGAVVESEQGLALARTFAIRINHSGAGSFTYSVGYSIIL